MANACDDRYITTHVLGTPAQFPGSHLDVQGARCRGREHCAVLQLLQPCQRDVILTPTLDLFRLLGDRELDDPVQFAM
jgi:hypothetical protein